MAKLPGVTLQVQNGNLGLVPPSAEKTLIYLGCSTSGATNNLGFYGSITDLQSALGYGEALEVAAYQLTSTGNIVGVLTLPPTTPGGFSSVVHSGTGSATMTVTAAPQAQILITIVAGGALGTGTFTWQLGSGAVSAVTVLPSGGIFRVPGTYTVITFGSGTYVAADTYTVSILGAITHSGTGTPTVTEASSPIDVYTPTVAVVLAGALGTAQVTFSLDGTVGNTSAAVVAPSGGAYALPNTGIVVTFSGALTLGDTYSFTSVGPTYTNSDLTAAMTALETTYLSASYSMLCCVGNLVSASAWQTQCATLEAAALALFNQGIYIRAFNGAPTVGTLTASSGTVVVDSADTDSVLETARITVSAPHVFACAGDATYVSVISGLAQRRNASWGYSQQAAGVEASQNPGFVGLGGLPSIIALYRDENATPGLDASGFNVFRTYPGNINSGTGLPGFFCTDFHTMDVVTSDYYPGMNARVIDLGCTVARASLLPFINSKVPTTTRNGIAGVITETKAQYIDAKVTGALQTQLVFTNPADAVAAQATTNRLHNVLSDSQLIVAVAIQPFGYAKYITVPIGLAVSV